MNNPHMTFCEAAHKNSKFAQDVLGLEDITTVDVLCQSITNLVQLLATSNEILNDVEMLTEMAGDGEVSRHNTASIISASSQGIMALSAALDMDLNEVFGLFISKDDGPNMTIRDKILYERTDLDAYFTEVSTSNAANKYSDIYLGNYITLLDRCQNYGFELAEIRSRIIDHYTCEENTACIDVVFERNYYSGLMNELAVTLAELYRDICMAGIFAGVNVEKMELINTFNFFSSVTLTPEEATEQSEFLNEQNVTNSVLNFQGNYFVQAFDGDEPEMVSKVVLLVSPTCVSLHDSLGRVQVNEVNTLKEPETNGNS